MEAEAAEKELVEGIEQTQSFDGVVADSESAAEDAAEDTTPPEPGSDTGWADDEEDEKWSVLLDRTKCQSHSHSLQPTA